MGHDGLWTIDELSAGVADALAAGYPGQSNGRVRDVPDRRTIRWYTTIGLLDRPAAMRGRTALYGRRHLLQLVAIKRLQADGRTLAAVQQELVGATDETLEDVAGLPADVKAPSATAPGPARDRFWAAPRPAVVPGIRLGTGVTVLLAEAGRTPGEDDLAAIEAAAAPLLDTLRRLGLDPAEDREGSS
ncbi:MAG TPA: MerR family transcriptional regulator [Pseudonocardiaceae bacterium]|nr:MerR family transcriptional regulator [Pseudonocardiaceae bacterium]